jgi:hypothetical protein
MGSSSLTHSLNPIPYTVNMFISIFMIQVLHNITNSSIFSDIGRNCLLGNRKKIDKFLMRTTFPYGILTLSSARFSLPPWLAGFRILKMFVFPVPLFIV